MMSNDNLDRGQRAIALLADIVRVWDLGFPSSADFSADPVTTLLIVDLANLIRRARAEIVGGGG